jgi:tRNA-dihydrouridine synthase
VSPVVSGVAQDSGGARSHDRWVINKVRALGSWYTKGLEGGSQLRVAINSAGSLCELRDLIASFFLVPALVA